MHPLIISKGVKKIFIYFLLRSPRLDLEISTLVPHNPDIHIHDKAQQPYILVSYRDYTTLR